MLRALLGEQADLVHRASRAWGTCQGHGWGSWGDIVAAQSICVQQLSDRCCYLEAKLQQLMDERHTTETATAP